ncbi:hypothetical protein F2P81_023062 [Scophthalmus maximus]|uniref:NADH dehydrogenase [ubiquinone] iron-sulfur protein 5 n=1 Tax=Scophthalmus maximus TaxID=52904 RepID=A0A6A4RY47_SCOMX|nr:hypothetical protein F2P81_023062 [Scophthalmus maximus]
MPFVDIQSRLGISIDHWLLVQSTKQPYKRASRCHAFEKEWIECSHGIGLTRAKKECQVEFEDFYECMHRHKTGFRCVDQILSPSPAARLCRKMNHVTTDQYLTDKGRMTSDLSPLLIVNVAAVCMRPAGRPISCCLIKAAAADYPDSFSLCWGPMREEEGLDYPAPPSTPPPPPPPPPTSTQHFQWYECLSSCRTKDT